MSNPKGWQTKTDILKDLAEVTGTLADVDERYIVQGAEPPRPIILEDDVVAEMSLLYGKDLYKPNIEISPPDLNGITQMIRMVDRYNDEMDDFDQRSVSSSEHIVISKLNPEVPEFVPKTSSSMIPDPAMSSHSSDKDKRINLNKKVSLDINGRDTNYQHCEQTNRQSLKSDSVKSIKNRSLNSINGTEGQKCDTSPSKHKRIDITELKSDEIKSYAMELRSKISDASKNDCFPSKREKNVAIATLLKLYSATPRQAESPKNESTDSDSDSYKQIKLFTPEYFETSHIGDQLAVNSVKTDNARFHDKNSKLNEELSREFIKTSEARPSTGNQETDETEKSSKPKLDAGNPIENKYAEYPDVQNSIDKVNKWFEPEPKTPPKERSLQVCLGPVLFKRKTPITSPPASDMDKSNQSTSSSNIPQTQQYKPSKYAEDLSKKFMAQGKGIEKQKLDIWQQAELRMKEKEAKLKKKIVENPSTSQESIDDDFSENN